jgi:uncharacterized membrane protein YfcA
MEPYLYIIAILGGFVAGVMNALAGFGSAVTLGIMIEFMGLPANLANGTNRINMLSQSSLSTLAYFRQGKLDLRKCWPVIISTTLGALLGVYLAVVISNETFKEFYRFMLLGMFLLILIRPKRWIRETDDSFMINRWFSLPLFFLLGILGGFIQMGFGVFALFILVLLSRYNIIEANAIKVAIIAIYTLVILIIFHIQGLVDWKVGLIFAVGQGSGGYLAAHLAAKYKNADKWVYWILVVIVAVILMRSFGVLDWIGGWFG